MVQQPLIKKGRQFAAGEGTRVTTKSSQGTLVLGGVVVVAAIALGAYFIGQGSDGAETATPANLAEVPAVATEAAPEPAPAAEPAPVVDITRAAPIFDTVRVEADGTAVIAGQFDGGGAVELRLDGAAIERIEAGADGAFAAFLTIAPSDQPRVLSLVGDPNGDAIEAAETVIIAPFGMAEPRWLRVLLKKHRLKRLLPRKLRKSQWLRPIQRSLRRKKPLNLSKTQSLSLPTQNP
ncbi:hypothetical protein A9199_01670 [Donghicola sp. JL3646]|nr:hypothetical protein A9199_01670 [Donghicola sp. JL3646]